MWDLGEDTPELPWNVFVGNSSLVILKLNGEFLLNSNISSNVSFSSPKILRLIDVTYANDASIQKMLCYCLVLEELQICRSNWDNVRNVVISVPSLKRLDIEFIIQEMDLYGGGEEDDDFDGANVEYKLFVDAPNLECLRMTDYMSDCIQVNYMPCVTESYLSVYKILEIDHWTAEQKSNHTRNVYGIFRSIPNAKYLAVDSFTLESLVIDEADFDRTLPIFDNLVHFELIGGFWIWKEWQVYNGDTGGICPICPKENVNPRNITLGKFYLCSH
ncbi:hypothetical protein ACH5RR_027920 [Cinchona calisaya]|uniref:Uncharacterized protein n=1 Tax=Cinchona calisaya TaxID=153742 RepID=A0ABD2YP97_9GENT